ncbi:SgcJ/EcaC family oxidoreductase [Nocardiopsis exhalans]|uniref:SgcJ/EcaC family oxidoreductase n=1 Tax=Nocardiopsis exhalans TaxID=163604 RepID=A0ABY5DI14_9ACTN|nr:SgcJ/EcaC family oxidoreductase [Nocardiopsis exhalans]USY22868.1 SgcJ/EcaC family oxidoreductase [Nocardiopsis exhalans]
MEQDEGPESVPHRFAQAWNRGDADGIAELFAPDADFVNVVGLWWHDRESIRNAHEYGLRVIFPGSTMRVSGVRSRMLGSEAAVVHCRWSVSGQVLPDGSPSGLRRGVFTFVVNRSDTGWAAVAAQNTDRVSGAESLARHEGGPSPVDYR